MQQRCSQDPNLLHSTDRENPEVVKNNNDSVCSSYCIILNLHFNLSTSRAERCDTGLDIVGDLGSLQCVQCRHDVLCVCFSHPKG